MCEKTMYEKIMEETRKIPESRTSKRLKQQITHLFIYSKEYAELYKTVQHIYNAKKILNSYLFDVSYFTITDKLYIEFFFECYKRVAPEEDKKHLRWLEDHGVKLTYKVSHLTPEEPLNKYVKY